MTKYNFVVRQHPDGCCWEWVDAKGGFVLGSEYLTREQAERDAQELMDQLNQRDEIAAQAKEKMLGLLEAWDGQIPSQPVSP